MNRDERTDMILHNYKGNPNESVMLCGLLCMVHSWDPRSVALALNLIDPDKIALRIVQLPEQFGAVNITSEHILEK